MGTAVTTTGLNTADQLDEQLSAFYDPARVSYVKTPGASHTFPTDLDAPGNIACSQSAFPVVSNCGLDGAGAVLEWMYGELGPRNTGTLSGSVLSFDQTGALGSLDLDRTRYLYVPKSCRLHVALHGCRQNHGHIGTHFIDNTVYNLWAGNIGLRKGPIWCDSLLTYQGTNNIIMLYPQAVVDYTVRPIWGGLVLSNPNGRFDWVSWYGNDADQETGKSSRRGQVPRAFVNGVGRRSDDGYREPDRQVFSGFSG